MTRHTEGWACVALLAVLAVFCVLPAGAKDWIAGTATWTVPDNWDPYGVPTYSHTVHIDNAGTARVISESAYANKVYLGTDSGQAGTVELNNGQYLYTDYGIVVGDAGTGTFNHASGYVSTYYSSGDIILGYAATGNGTYNLSGGMVSAKSTIIGRDGTGFFNQTGGTMHMQTGYDLFIGYASTNYAGNGTYRLSGDGTIVLGASNCDIFVGVDYYSYGTGRFEWFRQGGITENLGQRMWIGTLGTLAMGYDFTNMPSIVTGIENGTLEVTNGARVTKGDSITSVVKYLRIGSATGSGEANMTSGTVQVGQDVYVGDGGNGLAVQSGGTFNITTHLYLGINGSGVSGTYRLKGGSLNVGSNVFGGTGTGTLIVDCAGLAVSGSIISVDNLILGDESGRTGSYNMGGKSVTIGTHTIGNAGTGSFTQTGGTNNVTTLRLGHGTTGNGTYLLSGGALSVTNAIENGAGSGTLQIDGGTFAPSGNVAIDNLKVGISAGGSHSQTSLTYSIGELTLGAGTYTLSGGNLNVSGQTLNATGAGTLSIRGGTFTSGGSVNVDNLKIGDGATGSHTQAAQTYNVGDLTIGSGTYTLSGGTLNVSGQVLNGAGGGMLRLNGGGFAPVGNVAVDSLMVGDAATASYTHSAAATWSAGSMAVGWAGGNGTFRLSNNGQLNVSAEVTVGNGSTGRFEWFRTGGLTANKIILGSSGTLAMGAGFNVSDVMSLTEGLNNATLEVTNSAIGTHLSGTALIKTLRVGSSTGSGTYRQAWDGALTISSGGSIRIGADGGGGRFEWYTDGAPSSPSIVLGSAGTLAMGRAFDVEDLLDGSLFGGVLTGLSSAAMEITNLGQATQNSGAASIRSLAIGGQHGEGSYTVKGGSLRVQVLDIGMQSAGTFNLESGADVKVSQTLMFGPQAHLAAEEGCQITLTGSNVMNLSTRPDDLPGLSSLTLAFTPLGGGIVHDMMEVACLDMEATMEGFVSNFAMDTLSLGLDGGLQPAEVMLVDFFRNRGPQPEALYVHNIYVHENSVLDMNWLNVYYDGELISDGEIINGTPQFIPEPAALLLLSVGGLAAFRRRRRTT